MMRTLATSVALFSLLALAACGSTPSAEAPESGAAPGNEAPTPLWEFLGDSQNTFDQEEYEAKERQVQELTATCMKAQGFEYIPMDVSMGYAEAVSQEDEAAPYGTRAYAEKYGFGIAQNSMTMPIAPTEEFKDPNQAIVEKMSQSEIEAYYLALNGDGSLWGEAMTSSAAVPEVSASAGAAESAEATEATETAAVESAEASIAEEPTSTESFTMPEPTQENAGCQGMAQFEIHGAQYFGGGMTADPHQELWEEYYTLSEGIEKDPRMVEKIQTWSNCLADKGFPGHTKRWEVSTELSMKWEELHGATVTKEDGGWSSSYPEEPVTPDPAAVEAFKKEEIAVAVADFDCRGDLESFQRELTIELETAFVEKHKTELEQMRNEMNGG